jgi:hypothetical protein
MSELESKPSIDSQLSKRSNEGSNDEDDCDVCIIEDISHPAPTSRFSELENSLNMSQSSKFDYTQTYMTGGTRPKARDEQYILRVALQVGTFTLAIVLVMMSNHFVVIDNCYRTQRNMN